ncbi:hypothetical protein F2P79_016336 [Pimephales promelas]|nr:hypothetical protein F2P79_016336 [Pimephales promelas]
MRDPAILSISTGRRFLGESRHPTERQIHHGMIINFIMTHHPTPSQIDQDSDEYWQFGGGLLFIYYIVLSLPVTEKGEHVTIMSPLFSSRKNIKGKTLRRVITG